MAQDADPKFFQRADEFIQVANRQMSTVENPQRVPTALIWSGARYAAWLNASISPSREVLVDNRDDMVEAFTAQFKQLLTEQFDYYIAHYDSLKASQTPKA